MSVRIEFTLTDVARVRVGSSLGPLAESAFAYSGLQSRTLPLLTRPRLKTIRDRATARDRSLASFLWLDPGVGFDFFTLGGPNPTMTAGRDAVLGASTEVFGFETESWARLRVQARRLGVLPPLRDSGRPDEVALAKGDLDHWHAVLGQLEGGFSSWIAPSWSSIKDSLEAEEARLAALAGTGGVEALVAALGYGIRWTGSALELPDAGILGSCVREYELGGRGMTIVPSFFALEPTIYFPSDCTAAALLIVPAMLAGLTPAGRDSNAPRGAELLGRTRAAVLVSVARRPRTTSQLSQDLGIALSGASQHATVLRRAGLITTVREGGHVQHAITELGESLLARLSA